MQYSTAFSDGLLAIACAACVLWIGRARGRYGEGDQPALFWLDNDRISLWGDNKGGEIVLAEIPVNNRLIRTCQALDSGIIGTGGVFLPIIENPSQTTIFIKFCLFNCV